MAAEMKIRTKNKDVYLRVKKGHFATMHSHTNYFIDVTTQKMRLSEAKAVASELVRNYRTNTIIDTILCIDGMEVIGTCVADGLTSEHYLNMNAHQTIYVVSPEFITGGQMMFRDNLVPMLAGKNVLVLGFGREGRSTLKLLKKFDCKITVADRNVPFSLPSPSRSFAHAEAVITVLSRASPTMRTSLLSTTTRSWYSPMRSTSMFGVSEHTGSASTACCREVKSPLPSAATT